MGVVEGVGSLQTDQQRLGGRQSATVVEQAPKAPACQVLAHQVRGVFVLAPVVHGHDVRVGQPGRRPGLGLEAAEERAVARQRRVQELDRDLPSQGRVVGEKDLRRRAAAERGA